MGYPRHITHIHRRTVTNAHYQPFNILSRLQKGAGTYCERGSTRLHTPRRHLGICSLDGFCHLGQADAESREAFRQHFDPDFVFTSTDHKAFAGILHFSKTLQHVHGQNSQCAVINIF